MASDLVEGEAVELVLRDVGVLEEDAEDEVNDESGKGMAWLRGMRGCGETRKGKELETAKVAASVSNFLRRSFPLTCLPRAPPSLLLARERGPSPGEGPQARTGARLRRVPLSSASLWVV